LRDPYDILGVKRGASLDEVKAAYRRACKERHPDLGGSHEAMVELNTAYAFIINELRQGYQRQEQEEAQAKRSAGAGAEAWHDVGEASRDDKRDDRWRDIYRELDEELETIRRAAEHYDEQLRTMRRAAWQTGRRVAWAKLTWDDFFRFITRTARSGIKGIALLFAALVGVGSVLIEANFVSALILLGSGVGFAFSLALKSDKGGMLSAALLLFGIMTIWLPPVRSALVLYPVATISVLILLALIFKFAQASGMFGLMTGGVLALYVILVIVGDTSCQPPNVAIAPPQPSPPPPQTPIATPNVRPTPAPTPSPSFARVAPQEAPPQSSPPSAQIPIGTPNVRPPPPPAPSPSFARVAPQAAPPPPLAQPAPAPPEPRTLLAADGAILKFIAGVPYHLKVRTGQSTSLRATQGKVALGPAHGDSGACRDAFEFPVQTGAGPWSEIEETFLACGEDAVMTVKSVR